MKRFMVLVGAIALVLAACGGSGDGSASGSQPLESTCLAGEPDCNDTAGFDKPQELPGGADTSAGNGMAVNGRLTVAETLGTDAAGVLAVTGFVVSTGDEVRLCDALAEAYPPQCGGDSVPLDGLDAIDPDSLTTEGDVSWTDTQQTVFGQLTDGVLITT
ncbi:MAG: hypothetical protein WBV06_06600, partial [Acidimicrobiia bacterium]